MRNSTSISPGYTQQRILLCILLAEFLLFIFSGVSFSFLQGASFFTYGVDIFFGIVYFTSIPQFIVSQQWLAIAIDASIIILLLALIRNPGRNKIAVVLMLLLFIFYVTLMGYLNHRNFHIGFVVVLFPFIFSSTRSKYFAYEILRYYLLFFYCSAAIFKIIYGSFNHADHLSVSVLNQFTPYFVESNLGPRTEFNLFVIHNVEIGLALMILSFIAELAAAVGFFTKRFDRLIGFSILLFHLVNWFLMDLAPFGQLAFISLLFVGRAFSEKAGVEAYQRILSRS